MPLFQPCYPSLLCPALPSPADPPPSLHQRTDHSKMASIKLSSGHAMPQVGFGLWKVGTDVAADTVYNAIKAGYRLLDGACGE